VGAEEKEVRGGLPVAGGRPDESQILTSLAKKAEEVPQKGKVRQVVWLEPRLYAKIYELAQLFRLAPNVMIALIVEDYFEKGGNPAQPKVQVVEKVKERELVFCPECNEKFPDIMSWREHLRSRPQEVRRLIKDLAGLLEEGEEK
jgi:hypothetical protein